MSLVVITNPTLDGARAVVHVDALREHLARGWELVGPCSDRYRDPVLSDDEQLLADEAARALEDAARASITTPADEATQTSDSTDETDDTTHLDQES